MIGFFIMKIILKFWVKPWVFDGFCGETSIFGDPKWSPRTRQLRRDRPGLTARAAVPLGRTLVGSKASGNVRKKYQKHRDLRDLPRDKKVIQVRISYGFFVI